MRRLGIGLRLRGGGVGFDFGCVKGDLMGCLMLNFGGFGFGVFRGRF